MKKEYISTNALLMIGIISVVTGAIYANNLQADYLAAQGNLLAQQFGAPVFSQCGNGTCDPGEDQIICPSCAVDAAGNTFANCECTMICPQDCKQQDRCEVMDCPYGCRDGKCLPYQCPVISCAAPPDGCKYVPPYKTDEHGCQVGCGELACEDVCVTVDCAAPPSGCKYVDPTFNGQCQVHCGRLVCESTCGNGVCDQGEADMFDPGGCGPNAAPECLGPPARFIPGTCPNDCEAPQHVQNQCDPIVCPDGTQHPKCAEDGSPINYFADPCFKPKPSPIYCMYNGREYKPGESFAAGDSCNSCYCEKDGSVSCTEKACFDDGQSYCADAAGNVYRPGESFMASDGCNKCLCTENGEAACTKMNCGAAPSAVEEISSDDDYCYGTPDCNPGDVCSVEFGDCLSACPPGATFCPDVCAGYCMPKAFGDPYTLPQCSTTAQCQPGSYCTAEFTKDCFEQCPLSDDLCSVICGGKCIPFNGGSAATNGAMQVETMQPPAGQGQEYEDEVRTAPVESRFSDVTLDTLEGSAANGLANAGVIGGFADGSFRGDQPVNRAEAAKFLLMARLGGVSDARNNNRFLDVLEGEWYVKYVINAADLGIINGYPDGTFRPANTVNTAEFLKMLSITFGLLQDLPHTYTDVPEGAWFERYAGAAQIYDLFPGRPDGQLVPDRPLTRGEVAIAIYKLMENR